MNAKLVNILKNKGTKKDRQMALEPISFLEMSNYNGCLTPLLSH